jgi:hypothetical protein
MMIHWFQTLVRRADPPPKAKGFQLKPEAFWVFGPKAG